MKIEYQLTKTDFLQHQLYVASHSAQVKKRRNLFRWILPIIYAPFGLLLLVAGYYYGAALLLSVSIFWTFWYPVWSRKRYQKHYQKWIDENYQNRVNKPVELTITPEYIFSKDSASEGKIQLSQIEEVVRIPAHYLIKLQIGQSFIIPISYLKDTAAFEDHFRGLGFPVKQHTDWVWK